MDTLAFGRRPRLKQTVQMNIVDDTICLRASAKTTSIKGDIEPLKRLLSLMDGSRDLHSLIDALRSEFPNVSREDVLETVEGLDSLFLLEDAGQANSVLSDYDVARWHRNINFFGSFCRIGQDKYELQARIKQAKVTVLGLGGLGSHLVYDLAAMGVMDIQAVEFDRVEISNLNRQILYNEEDIGRLKSEVAVERMKRFSPNLKLQVIQRQIEGVDDVLAAIRGRDVVLCVADRPKMEIHDWVNEACMREGIPLLSGGLETQMARYFTIIPGESGCLACWRRQVQAQDEFSDALLSEQRRTQLRGDNAAFVSLVAFIASMMLAEFTKIITGIAAPVALGKTKEIDFKSMDVYTGEEWTLDPECPVCKHCHSSGTTRYLAEAV